MSAEPPPPVDPPDPPVPSVQQPVQPLPVNPYGPGKPSRYHWAAILGGVVLGFLAWVFMSFIVILGSSFGTGVSPTADAVIPWLFLALIALAIALIVWPRSRALGKGFLLGNAIGVVVAGGLCVPIIFSA